MSPELAFCELEFTYLALDPIAHSTMKSALWHSVFGRALHQLNCIFPGKKCKDCHLLYQCNYPYLFDSVAPPDSEMMRGNKIPAPHIFRFEGLSDQVANADETFTVKLVILGTANERGIEIIRAMQRAGMNGYGNQRSRAKLLSVYQLNTEESPMVIMEQGQIISVFKPQQTQLPDPPKSIQLTFITPYIATSKNNAQTTDLDVGYLLMTIIRRISLVQYFYTGNKLKADFPQLKTCTESPTVINKTFTWQSGRRYSASHGETIDTSGWIGSLEMQLEPVVELWPYLWLGQWLSVGKNASMGFGRYYLR